MSGEISLVAVIDGHTYLDVRSFSSRRGKSSELGEWSAGQATLVLGDTDGDLDPLRSGSTASTWQPGTPARVAFVDVDDASHEVFTGFLSSSPQPSSDPISHDLLVTLDLVDLIGWGAGFPMPDSEWSALVAAKNPAHGMWIPGDAPFSADTASLFAARYVAGHSMALGPFVGSNPFDLGDAIVPGSQAPSVVLGPYRVAQGTPYFAGSEGSTGYTVALWMQSDTVSTQTILTAGFNSGGSLAYQLRLEGTGQVTWLWVNSDGTNTSAQTASGVRHDDNKPHLLVGWVDLSARQVWLVTDLDTSSSGNITSGKTPRTLATVQLGFASSTQAAVRVSHLLVQPGPAWLGPVATLAAIAPKLAAGTPAVWDQDTPTQRATNILASVPGIPAPTSIIAQTQNSDYYTGEPIFYPYSRPANVGDALLSLGTALLGSAYMTAGGSLYVRCGVAFGNPDYAARLVTPIGELSDDPDATGVVRYSARARSGQRVDRVINRASTTVWFPAEGGDWTITALDEASIATYGERATDVQHGAFFIANDEVLQAYVDRYKTPTVEIGDVVIEPVADAAAKDLVIGAELENVLTYTETPPYSSTPVYDQVAMRIIRIDWDWQDGLDWKVTFGLELA